MIKYEDKSPPKTERKQPKTPEGNGSAPREEKAPGRTFTSKTKPLSIRLHPEVANAWRDHEPSYTAVMARLITDYAFHQGWL